MLDYLSISPSLTMGILVFFWICSVLTGIVAGKMGRRAWTWVIYGALTGPVGLFHILMLAAFQIKREKVVKRAVIIVDDTSIIVSYAPFLTESLAVVFIADNKINPDSFGHRFKSWVSE